MPGPYPELTSQFGVAFCLLAIFTIFVTLHVRALGLVILIFSIPLSAARYVGHTTISAEKVALVAILAVMLKANNRKHLPRILCHPILLASYGLILADLLSALHSHNLAAVFHETAKQIEYVLLLVCAAMVASHETVEIIDQGVCASATIAVGVVSVLAAAEGILGNSPSGIWINDQMIPRVAGPLEGPNQLAGYLELTLPIIMLAPATIGLALGARRFAIVSGTTSLVLTQTRSAIALMLVAFVAWMALHRGQLRTLISAPSTGLLIGVTILGLWYASAFRDMNDAQSVHAEAAEIIPQDSRIKVRFVGANAPGAIDAIGMRLMPPSDLVGTVVTTSNVASISMQAASKFARTVRSSFGIFHYRLIADPAESRRLLINILAIKTDGTKTRCLIEAVIARDGMLTTRRYDGLAAIRLETAARMLDPSVLQNPGGVGTRSQLWRAALIFFKRSPLTGIGAGNFETSLSGAGLPRLRTTANSLFLQTAAEQGIAGLLALIVFVVVVITTTCRLARTQWLAAAVTCGTILFLLHQTVDDLMFFPKVASMWWILIGVLVPRSTRGMNSPREMLIHANATTQLVSTTTAASTSLARRTA